eukprot:23048-Pelagococcus_subviridis.AAC.4
MRFIATNGVDNASRRRRAESPFPPLVWIKRRSPSVHGTRRIRARDAAALQRSRKRSGWRGKQHAPTRTGTR